MELSLWIHRRALGSLVRYDLRRAYAGTAAGTAWTFISPLIPILIFSAVFAMGLKLPLGNAPYFFGFICAYVPWVLLSASIATATGSLIEHRNLVKRIRFPVEIIPSDAVLVHSLPHVFLVTLAAAVCAIGGYVRLPQLPLLVYFYGCAAVLTIGAGWLVSSIAVVARDFQQMLPSMLQVWFWLTPVAWPSERLPPLGRTLVALNPAAYIVAGYRHALMPDVFAGPTAFESGMFWLVAIAMLAAGSASFRRLRVYFWECL